VIYTGQRVGLMVDGEAFDFQENVWDRKDPRPST
jgi:hypothetical protein